METSWNIYHRAELSLNEHDRRVDSSVVKIS